MADKNVQVVFEGNNKDLLNSIKQLESRLGKLDKKTKDTAKNTESSFSKMGTAIKGILPAALVAGAVAGFAKITGSLAELENQARLTGLSASELSKFQSGLKGFGVSAEQTTDALKEISKRSAEAVASGSGAIFDILEKNNIDSAKFAELNASEQAKIYTKLIKDVGSASGEAKRIADVVGGESGSRALLALAAGGAAAVENARSISQETITIFGNLNKEISTIFTDSFAGIADTLAPAAELATGFISAFKDGLPILVEFFANIGNFLTQFALEMENINTNISIFFKESFLSVVSFINDVIKTVVGSFDPVIEGINNIIDKANNIPGFDIKPISDPFRDVNIDGFVSDVKRSIDVSKESIDKNNEAITVIKKEIDAGFENASTIGKISQAKENLNKQTNKLTKSVEKSIEVNKNAALVITDRMKKMDEIGKSTAAALQSNFEDVFFNAMKGDFGGLLDGFINTLDKMVAKSLATDLAGALGLGSGGGSGTNFLSGILGGSGGGSGGGGFDIGGIFSSVASSFGGGIGGGIGSVFSGISSFFGGFANGGVIDAGRTALVGENGPELITPLRNTQVMPNSGGSVVVNMTVNTPDANSFGKNQRQIVADLTRSINTANGRDL